MAPFPPHFVDRSPLRGLQNVPTLVGPRAIGNVHKRITSGDTRAAKDGNVLYFHNVTVCPYNSRGNNPEDRLFFWYRTRRGKTHK